MSGHRLRHLLYIPLRSDITNETGWTVGIIEAALYPTTFRYNLHIIPPKNIIVATPLYPTTFRYNNHLCQKEREPRVILYIPLRSDITKSKQSHEVIIEAFISHYVQI